jgi:hypothetical protein
MNLMDLISMIIGSQPTDWNHIACWGPTKGPYRYGLDFHDVYEGEQPVIAGSSHTDVCSYMTDLSISLAFGLKWMDSFKEPWVERFPDPRASASFIDVFYNGSLVFRTEYVTVDGGRTRLPLPRGRNELTVPQRQVEFIHVIDQLGKQSSFCEDFSRAGMKAVDVSWPKFG